MSAPLARPARLDASQIPEGSLWRWWRGAVDSVAILLSSGVAGAALVFVSLRFGDAGPVLFLCLALLPVVGVVVFERAEVVVLLTFATFPVVALLPWTAGLAIEPVQAMVIVGAVLLGIRRLAAGRTPLVWSRRLWWAVALFAWMLVALPSSTSLDPATKQVLYLGGGILFVLVIASCCDTPDALRRVLGGLIGIGMFAAITALLSGVEPQSAFGGAVISGRAVGTFTQPNQLGAFTAMVSMVAAGMTFGAATRVGRVLGVTAFFVLFAALALSLSRGAWIGAALGGVYLTFALPSARRAIGMALIPLALVLIAAASFAPDTPQLQVVGERLQAFTAENPYDSRPKIWDEARRQVVADPWTGQGPGNFAVVSARSGSEASTVFADHAHNLWLNWAAEAGLPAVLIIFVGMGVLGATARSARKMALAIGRPRDAALVAGCAAAAITVIGQGLVDYPLKNQVIWFTVWAIVGLLIAARRSIDETVPLAMGRRLDGDEPEIVDQESLTGGRRRPHL